MDVKDYAFCKKYRDEIYIKSLNRFFHFFRYDDYMRRPRLVHFMAFKTTESICIKAFIHIGREDGRPLLTPRFPIQGIPLLRSTNFILKITGFNQNNEEIFQKNLESDSFGHFDLKIPITQRTRQIEMIKAYETASYPGLEIFLGDYPLLNIISPKKIIICDLDKTLLETKWARTREIYDSLVKPLNSFPTILKSVALLKKHIDEGFCPFILSGSPHFYENAIRDWLYQHEISAAGIFLKDYRQILSPFERSLTPRDLKIQGTYKLGHLFKILLMTGIPSRLVLMGDNFESDPLVYLTLAAFLKSDLEPWAVWNEFKEQKNIHLNKKQNALFLDRMYQLNTKVKKFKENGHGIDLKIYIRKKSVHDQIVIPEKFEEQKDLVELYEADS